MTRGQSRARLLYVALVALTVGCFERYKPAWDDTAASADTLRPDTARLALVARLQPGGLATVPGHKLEAIAVTRAGFDPQIDRPIAAQVRWPLEPPAGDIEDDLSPASEGQPLGGHDQSRGEHVLIRADQDLPFPLHAFALQFTPGFATRSPGVGDRSLIVRRR